MIFKRGNSKKSIIIFLLSTFYFLFSIFYVFAAELKYFDFSPEISGSINVSGLEKYQFFTPYDDYISGFDIWAENTGSAGTASFGLRDSNNNLLASKTISIPYIPKSLSGQKLHVQFDNPAHLNSNQNYKIKIISSMPKLKVYYGYLTELQIHNANEFMDIHMGPAYIGDYEQDFAFKFALYEDGDVSIPIVSNIVASVISADKVKINFNANEPVDYRIVYGIAGESLTQNTSYSANYVSCHAGINNCSLEISVFSNKNYIYQLFAKDVWGNEAQFSGSFISSLNWMQSTSTQQTSSTPPEISQDITAPVISGARIVSLTDKSVRIAWETNEAANSSLLVGLNAPGMRVLTSIGDSTYELEHVLSSGDLLRPNTDYYAVIASIDYAGNYVSQIINFTASQSVPINPPDNQNQNQNQNNQPSPDNQQRQEQQNQNQNNQNQQNNQQNNQNQGSVIDVFYNESGGSEQMIVSWPLANIIGGGYRIDIFDNNYNLQKQIFVPRGTEGNISEIKDLPSGSYNLIVYADNNGVFEKVAPVKNFNTSELPKKNISNSFSEKIRQSFWFYIILAAAVFFIASIGFYVLKRKNIL